MPLSLESLGLGPREDRVYLGLLEWGSADAADLAGALGLAFEEAIESLELLTRRGLIHQEAFSGLRYHVISPRVAVPELIRRQRLELNRLQDEADRVCDDIVRQGAELGVVEPVVGVAAVYDVCADIERGARHEVLLVDAPPYFEGGSQPNESELAALAKGVRYRVIYHRDAVVTEESRQALRRYVAAGEEARLHAEAWPKLLVADGSVALVPESARDPDPGRRLLIRSSLLVDLIVSQFELMWEQATPVEALGRARLTTPDDSVSDRDRELLTLLAAGLKDRAIARSLGVTERTVSRRIQELMRRLDADTRFRAGIRAAQRGWIAG